MSAAVCRLCGRPIIRARTVPGKAMQPLDPEPYPDDDTAATVAVHRDHLGSHYARTLRKGEEPFANERRYMPHFATCPAMAAERAAQARSKVDQAAQAGDLVDAGVLPFRRPGRDR